MKFEDFVTVLLGAGWKPVGDAQYNNIKLVHSVLFPIIAELEEHITSLEELVSDLSNDINKLNNDKVNS